MSATDLIYKIFFKRTSVFAATIIAGSVGVEYGMNALGDAIWINWNKGKFFKDFEDEFRKKGILREKGWDLEQEDEDEEEEEDEDDEEL